MKKLISLCMGLVCIVFISQAQTVTDYDGNAYDTVVIGTQVWLRQNLRVTRFNDGTFIPLVTDSTEWTNTASGSRCYYNNDSAAYDTVYGALYNGYVINDISHICPAGWHVTTDAEWQEAESFLGGWDVAGGKMKETGTVHWITPNAGATNSSGFTGLPGGMRDLVNIFSTLGENGLWWTTTAYNSSTLWTTYLWNMSTGVDHNPAPKNYGLSIRCVRDVFSGHEDIGIARQISLYPNPAANNILIDYPGNDDLQVQLYTISGAFVTQHKLSRQSNEIDLSQLPKGIYIVKIIAAGRTLQKKLIKL
jgi:uncharacterized protein (TIGR02145 family)